MGTVAICDAVKDLIAGGGYSQDITLNRVNLPDEDYKRMDEDSFYCTVFPGTRSTQRATRATFHRRYTVFIAVYTKIRGDSVAERKVKEDQLITLGEEIEDWLLPCDLFDGAYQHLEEPDVTAPPFIPETADSKSIFVTVWAQTYFGETTNIKPVAGSGMVYLRDEYGDYLRDEAGFYLVQPT